MWRGGLRSAAPLCTDLFFGGITGEWDYQTGFHKFLKAQRQMPSPAAELMGQFIVHKKEECC